MTPPNPFLRDTHAHTLLSSILLFADDLKFRSFNASVLQMDAEAVHQRIAQWIAEVRKPSHHGEVQSLRDGSANVLVVRGENGLGHVKRIDNKNILGIRHFQTCSQYSMKNLLKRRSPFYE
ncbi:hypothetical protein T265_09768 [Opisthorchis viverrini]|uniref:Uncharacterized protein n=1 Tax=Opisthorchis viverrini TaxID=6198 RepID=A0A075A3T5_OPIVI|nr:hypothetical protein T265_09768 [Opisthorchis viverrini]KER22054.1 hypothetical protein T265_09768 [Opisthorchis viverrini]